MKYLGTVLLISLFGLHCQISRSQSTTYTFDHSNRLINAGYNKQREITYSYDNDGNRTSQQIYDNPTFLATVGLQGDMQTNGTMRSDLQNYFGGNVGLLPTTDPYGLGQVYNQINKPTGPAGTIVDWVKVTIRSSSSPATVLQTRALLLKTNGTIVDTSGNAPRFDAQNGSVRVAIQHRNHLAILSNSISSLGPNTTATYNFTTSLSQASNDYSDPPQMVQVGGKWCMWAGDVNATQDYAIDNADFLLTRTTYLAAPFDVYNKFDLNMDGTVDNSDFLIQRLNYQQSLFSTLINY